MTPESITVSLDLAKQLRDAGYPQGFSGVFAPQTVERIDQILPANQLDGSYFYWMDVRSDYTKGEPSPQVESIYCNYPMIAAAPTAEEILRKLPEVLYLGEERVAVYLNALPDDNKWIVSYSEERNCDVPDFWKRDKESLANAAAAMYLYLFSHNLLP